MQETLREILWKFLVGFISVERYKPFSTDLSLWKDYNFCSIGVWPGIVTCFCQWHVSGSDMWHFWEQTLRTVTGCANSCFPRLWDWHVLIVVFFFFRLYSQIKRAGSGTAVSTECEELGDWYSLSRLGLVCGINQQKLTRTSCLKTVHVPS